MLTFGLGHPNPRASYIPKVEQHCRCMTHNSDRINERLLTADQKRARPYLPPNPPDKNHVLLLTTGHLSSLGTVAGLATRTRTPPLGFPPSLLFLLLPPLAPSSSSRHGIAHTAIPP